MSAFQTTAFDSAGFYAGIAPPVDRTLVAAGASVALTGQNTTLRAGRRQSAFVSAFALSSADVGVVRTVRVGALVRTFALSGPGTGLLRAARMAPFVGSFIFSGPGTDVVRAVRMAPSNGSFSLVGQPTDVSLWIPRPAPDPQIELGAGEIGAFELSGEALAVNRLLEPLVGAFTLSGQEAQARVSRRLGAQVFTFGLSGNGAGLVKTAYLGTDAGGATASGLAVDLRASRRIAPAPSARSATFLQANVLKRLRLQGERGHFSVLSAPIIFGGDKLLTAEMGSVAVSHSLTVLLQKKVLDAGIGAVSVTGVSAGTRATRRLVLNTGSFAAAHPSLNFRKFYLVAEGTFAALTAGEALLRLTRRIVVNTSFFALGALPVQLIRQLQLQGGFNSLVLNGRDTGLIKELRIPLNSLALGAAAPEIDLFYMRRLLAETRFNSIEEGALQLLIARYLQAIESSSTLQSQSVVFKYIRTFSVYGGQWNLASQPVWMRRSDLPDGFETAMKLPDSRSAQRGANEYGRAIRQSDLRIAQRMPDNRVSIRPEFVYGAIRPEEDRSNLLELP